MKKEIAYADNLLNSYGFTRDRTERIFDEWLPNANTASLGTANQASAIAAELLVLQNGPCDVACIYDAKCGVGAYSPLFNPLTFKPHKAYCAFTAFNELRKLGTSVAASSDDPQLEVAAAAKDGRAALLVANARHGGVTLALPRNLIVEKALLTDDTRTASPVTAYGFLPPHSFLILTGKFEKKVP